MSTVASDEVVVFHARVLEPDHSYACCLCLLRRPNLLTLFKILSATLSSLDFNGTVKKFYSTHETSLNEGTVRVPKGQLFAALGGVCTC